MIHLSTHGLLLTSLCMSSAEHFLPSLRRCSASQMDCDALGVSPSRKSTMTFSLALQTRVVVSGLKCAIAFHVRHLLFHG